VEPHHQEALPPDFQEVGRDRKQEGGSHMGKSSEKGKWEKSMNQESLGSLVGQSLPVRYARALHVAHVR
jgi:hypothetical protein